MLRGLPEAEGEAGREALREVVGDGEYFHVHLPDGTQARASSQHTSGTGMPCPWPGPQMVSQARCIRDGRLPTSPPCICTRLAEHFLLPVSSESSIPYNLVWIVAQLAHPILRGERFPLNFGRTVVAALADKPERADWKNCEASPAEEEERTAHFKEKFKGWDPM